MGSRPNAEPSRDWGRLVEREEGRSKEITLEWKKKKRKEKTKTWAKGER